MAMDGSRCIRCIHTSDEESNRNRFDCTASSEMQLSVRSALALHLDTVVMPLSTGHVSDCDCAKVNMLQPTGRNVPMLVPTLSIAGIRMHKRVHALNSDLDLTSASFRFVSFRFIFTSSSVFSAHAKPCEIDDFAVKFKCQTEDAPRRTQVHMMHGA